MATTRTARREGPRRAIIANGDDGVPNDDVRHGNPVCYDSHDAWPNRVRGQNPSTFFGIYDVVVRWDTVSVAS
jgi:hypothetical protein